MTQLVPQHIIDRILEFDPSDRYHMPNEDVENNFETKLEAYYAGIDRVIKLLQGDITDWKDRG